MYRKTKLYFLFFITIFSSSLIFGQESKFQGGLLTGVNFSYFNDRIGEFGDRQRNVYESTFRLAPMIGLCGRYQISDLFSAKAEFIFSSRGGSYQNPNTGVITMGGDMHTNYFKKNYRLNYLEVPIMGEIDLLSKNPTEKLHLRFGAGVAYGLLLSSSLRYNGYAPIGSGSGVFQEVKENYTVVSFDYAKSSIMNYIFDLSLDMYNNETPIFVKFRNEGSLTPVFKYDSLNGDNLITKMNTWSFCVGFYFS